MHMTTLVICVTTCSSPSYSHQIESSYIYIRVYRELVTLSCGPGDVYLCCFRVPEKMPRRHSNRMLWIPNSQMFKGRHHKAGSMYEGYRHEFVLFDDFVT